MVFNSYMLIKPRLRDKNVLQVIYIIYILVTAGIRMLVMSCQEGDRLTRCGELKVTMQVEGLAPCRLVAAVVSKPGW